MGWNADIFSADFKKVRPYKRFSARSDFTIFRVDPGQMYNYSYGAAYFASLYMASP